MEEDIKRISFLLDKQFKIQMKLFELENIKTEALLKGDVKKLDDIVNLEQPLIMGSCNIEKQRDDLQSGIGYKGVTLKQIIDKFPNPDASLLKTHYDRLTDIVVKLKKVNFINHKILKSRLGVIDFILQKTGFANDEPLTYKKQLRSKIKWRLI